MITHAIVVLSALGLAAMLGTADAPNASAALLASGARPWGRVAVWSAGWHLAGGLLAGATVARTLLALVQVHGNLLAPTVGAGTLSAIGFTKATTGRGLPTSASIALVGGLAGAGVAAGGWRAVEWVGTKGLASGVVGVLAGIVLAPILGGLAAAALNAPARRAALRLRRPALRPLRGATWAAAAAVAFADGSNDGQKAFAVLAVAGAGAGTLGGGRLLPFWQQAIAAGVLAACAGWTGRRVVRRVARGQARPNPIDGLAAQAASAAVLFGSSAIGLPLSTSSVVASSVVGAAGTRRHRHVRWGVVGRILVAWAVTVPACALLGAGLAVLWRVAAR